MTIRAGQTDGPLRVARNGGSTIYGHGLVDDRNGPFRLVFRPLGVTSGVLVLDTVDWTVEWASEQADREPSEDYPDAEGLATLRANREPSEVEVKIALDTYFACDFYADYPRSVPYHEPRMRAALLAAQEVRDGR